MQGFEPFFHKTIVFEELNIQFYNGGFLKRLLEGRPYARPAKCRPDSIFSFKGPVIFIWNDYIRMYTYGYAMLSRLHWQGTLAEEGLDPRFVIAVWGNNICIIDHQLEMLGNTLDEIERDILIVDLKSQLKGPV